ncbi:hypothetical protein GCM10010378_07320 [Streptomyces viridochromogenes]
MNHPEHWQPGEPRTGSPAAFSRTVVEITCSGARVASGHVRGPGIFPGRTFTSFTRVLSGNAARLKVDGVPPLPQSRNRVVWCFLRNDVAEANRLPDLRPACDAMYPTCGPVESSSAGRRRGSIPLSARTGAEAGRSVAKVAEVTFTCADRVRDMSRPSASRGQGARRTPTRG